MKENLLEHQGVVREVGKGCVTVALETAGCRTCGQGGSCGIGKLAAGRPAPLVVLPTERADLQVGDPVLLQVPEGRLAISALLGYLFPAIALLAGAGLGHAMGGSDGAAALGAMAGFLAALAMARLAIAVAPCLLPAPRVRSVFAAKLRPFPGPGVQRGDSPSRLTQ